MKSFWSKKEQIDREAGSFFRRSIISVVIVCTLVFTFLMLFMAKQTKKSVLEISSIYMGEMNEQIHQKFASIISLRLEQVEGIIKRALPQEWDEYSQEMAEELWLNADIRNFSFLGLCMENGEIEEIYGEALELSHVFHAQDSLLRNGNLVAQGKTKSGEKVLILGKAAEYPMKNGERSAALVVGVPMDYLNTALFLNERDSRLYYHIIDSDGNFVIRNGDAYRENYFERMLEEFETYDGKSAKEHIELLKKAISAREDYQARVSIGGKEQHFYCSPLSEDNCWYLISAMPNDFLSESIAKLDKVRLITMIGCISIVLGVMSIILVLYFRLARRQMKELIRLQAEAVSANMAKSEFLSSMSHDIRTPMNAIIGMTEIAQKNVGDSERVAECLRKVSLSSKHLLGLINDVLDMSKIESGKMTLNIVPMSLRNAMDDIVNIMQPQVKERRQFFDIFIKNILSEDVYCDNVRLSQVLLNLLSNAVKFTPEQGRIDVHMYQEESPKGAEFVRVHFLVEDTGIGMSEEFQKKIWETFTREETDAVRHIVGAGLGTSITKSIVDLMEGTIDLKSELGKGTSFHVTLDLKKATITEDEMKLPEWDILVVDDNEQLCISAVVNLEELGVHADWAMSGEEALKRIAEHQKAGKKYDFILVDWKMPEMDGLETIHEIQQKFGSAIRVFLISAYDWSEIEAEASDKPFDGFIAKPLFKSTLYERLRQYEEGYNQGEQQEAQEIDFSGKKILLAEDMDINWEVAFAILSDVGLELERAVNGKECLEMFEASKISYYDAILMDIRMPIMDGYQATKEIRKLERADSKLPIIAMTADAFSDDAQHCMEVGMDAHIPKPLDVEECMRVLQKFLLGQGK
ncbi:MAG: response regulator [Lachnospiraceae bacterium]|jgi:two-component system sensor histidine kinase/response regulator|nr:response regulator [Lachnospiraceae bacterium]